MAEVKLMVVSKQAPIKLVNGRVFNTTKELEAYRLGLSDAQANASKSIDTAHYNSFHMMEPEGAGNGEAN